MKKNVLIGVIVCAVVIFILWTSTTIMGCQTVQSSNQKTMSTCNDQDVVIRAGVHERTNGNYGFGVLIIVQNNHEAYLVGDLKVYWDTLSGRNLQTYNASFKLLNGAEVRYTFDDRGPLFHPIIKLTVIVNFPETSTFVARGGTQIGRFVFF
jgi:hypothetical protein